MSNQIEMIEKLYAKVKNYKIPMEPKEGESQLSVEITPLSLEDMGLFGGKEDMTPSEMTDRMQKLVSKSLSITEAEASKISFEFVNDIFTAIMDANNFKDEDAKKIGIKDFLEKKREQMKKQKEDSDVESN